MEHSSTVFFFTQMSSKVMELPCGYYHYDSRQGLVPILNNIEMESIKWWDADNIFYFRAGEQISEFHLKVSPETFLHFDPSLLPQLLTTTEDYNSLAIFYGSILTHWLFSLGADALVELGHRGYFELSDEGRELYLILNRISPEELAKAELAYQAQAIVTSLVLAKTLPVLLKLSTQLISFGYYIIVL